MSTDSQDPSPDDLSRTLETLAEAVNYRDWLHAVTLPWLGRRVLDVGAGMGTMTDAIRDRDLVVALEPEARYAELLRDRYRDQPQVQVWEVGATDAAVPARSRAAGVDSAMSFNVFEHIEDDDAAFRVVHDALPAGGRFVCFVPAFPVLYGEMDRALGHFRRYRRGQLATKARAAGFEVEMLHHMNLPGFFAWWANGRLLRSRGVSGGGPALRIYDATVIRLSRALEQRHPPPFGQSLLLVARRPDRPQAANSSSTE